MIYGSIIILNKDTEDTRAKNYKTIAKGREK